MNMNKWKPRGVDPSDAFRNDCNEYAHIAYMWC